MTRQGGRLFMASMLLCTVGLTIAPMAAFAQSYATANTPSSTTINLDAQTLVPRASIFVSPSSQTVLEGATFDVSIYLNTEGNSANTIDAMVQFPPDKLAIVNPSGGKSLIQIWLQPPSYSNTDGTARYTGIIPNGVITSSGLIITITFKALAPGNAPITISPESSVLANDGLGTQMQTEFGRADYTITPIPPAGVNVYSPTHPFQTQWYNNNSPVLDWDKDPDVTAFSYVLDNQPGTDPPDIPNSSGTTMAYNNLGDGLWYFHIKSEKLGTWGSPTTFLVQIDTQPPASFTPIADIISGSQGSKALISFFTTDGLSGIDHYEVAVTDNNAPPITSPVFVQAVSPYQLNVSGPGSYHVIVRAVDKAGNVRNDAIDVTISIPFIQYLKDHDLQIILWLMALIIFLFILHYFFGHRLLRRAHKAILAIEHEERLAKIAEAEKLVEQEKEFEATEEMTNDE